MKVTEKMLFEVFAKLLDVLTDPDKYQPLMKALREEQDKANLVVSAVGPAKEIAVMHVEAKRGRDEAKRLLSESRTVSERLRTEAEAAKVTIITNARTEADANTAATEARLDEQRTTTQNGTDKLASNVAGAIQKHEVREAAVKAREDKVKSDEEDLAEGKANLATNEADLKGRLDNLNAAMQKSGAGKTQAHSRDG